MVAPAYISDSYVDHELSANLDSTFAFEGPEKLLEIWLWSHEDRVEAVTGNREGLRSIPLEEWVKILDLVSCKILSMKSSKFMDAYLLSESSLFVFPHKIILKTCGTTTTLFCIEKLFETIQKHVVTKLTSKDIYKVFYSRRSFMFPEKQKHIHRDWKNEVKLLNDYFLNGKSYVVGNFNSDDHWYLYTGGEKLEDQECNDHANHPNDQTFEILMTDLDPEAAEQFITSRKPGFESLVKNGAEEDDLGHEFGIKTMESSGLNAIFDKHDSYVKNHLPSPRDDDCLNLKCFDFIHDAFSFTPCGYSSNSISDNNGGYYYTLHITPESGWSYASFETNYPFSGTSQDSITIIEVLRRVLSIFKPGRFSMTLINEIQQNEREFDQLFNSHKKLVDYKKKERVFYDLDDSYKLLYLNFEKN